MKQFSKLFLISILFLSIISCFGPGVQDFSTDLINNYSINRTSSHNIMITPKDGWNDKIATIPTKVLKVNVYENFIIAERQGLKKRSPNNSQDTYEIPDEIIKDYWILNTSKNYVLGNLKFSTFQKKLDSLNIPKNIKLIDVYDY